MVKSKKSKGTVIAEETRTKCNKLSNIEREILLKLAMDLIHNNSG